MSAPVAVLVAVSWMIVLLLYLSLFFGPGGTRSRDEETAR